MTAKERPGHLSLLCFTGNFQFFPAHRRLEAEIRNVSPAGWLLGSDKQWGTSRNSWITNCSVTGCHFVLQLIASQPNSFPGLTSLQSRTITDGYMAFVISLHYSVSTLIVRYESLWPPDWTQVSALSRCLASICWMNEKINRVPSHSIMPCSDNHRQTPPLPKQTLPGAQTFPGQSLFFSSPFPGLFVNTILP